MSDLPNELKPNTLELETVASPDEVAATRSVLAEMEPGESSLDPNEDFRATIEFGSENTANFIKVMAEATTLPLVFWSTSCSVAFSICLTALESAFASAGEFDTRQSDAA